MTKTKPKSHAHNLLLLAAICLLLTLSGPYLFDTYLLNVLIKGCFFAMAAITVDLLWGYSGYLTFGQSAFFGLGAYAAALGFSHFGFSPLSALLSFAAALFGAALLALLVGWLSFYRGASPFFATVISLVLPIVAAQAMLSGGTVTGSSSGLSGFDSFDLSLEAWYVLAAGGLSLLALLAWWMMQSDGGRVLLALRDNEERCAYLGINTAYFRIGLLMVCGTLAALAGFGYGAFSGVVAPELCGFVFGTELIIWVALGGRASVWGAVIGALVINWVSSYLSSSLPFIWQLLLGLAFILVILWLPGGLLPLLLRPFQRFWQGTAPVVQLTPAVQTTEAHPASVQLSGVTKQFGSLKVLEGIDFAAKGGELVGLIGPNGAGKTTLMRCLADGAERSAGQVLLCGQSIGRRAPNDCVRLGLGRKFQNANVFPSLSVAESLQLSRLRHQRPRWWGRARQLDLPDYALAVLKQTGLDQQLTAIASDLSHGQQQALELCMVLALAPRIVLLDEPTAGLSKAERSQIGKVLAQLAHDYGLCCLLVEHDLDFVAEIATRIVVLHQGRIVMDGSFAEVASSELVKRIYAGMQQEGHADD
ncbi:branched-chain amino acid ABC transporter substrate-binding protein [Ventosimonas gracilis]|uniref:Branched-chain amino acid ABC transporter substrate-binding protein n=1 Tax=Ventosimonas gracilis TaxID=1680762 RepID=A0A139SRN6_9GAMM|nr:branched-chain amino acid ABC transporter ATP-binding protein/permease [Ventosimonas gracilis]KXU37265.1 branched-chain amino acid ABC transporter substrate-binding protein [Ventosimonas gracilis]